MDSESSNPGQRVLRILHVLEAIEGGTSRYLIDLVRNVEKADHHIAIPSDRRGGATDPLLHDALEDSGATVHLVEMARSPIRAVNAGALRALRALIRNLQPSVVHTHSAVGGALGRLAAIGTGAPTVYTPQGIAVGRASQAIERALGRTTSRLIAASPSEAELALRLRLVPTERIVTIRNGIDLGVPDTGEDLRGRLGLPPGTPLVGTIARLVPQKAPEVFVAACAHVARRHERAHFLLVGSGALQALLDAEVARHGLSGRFHQIRAEPDAAWLLGQLDVFALSSRFEGAPYAPMEAMRAATPVVMTDVVGSRDTVEHGLSGLLVPAEDPAALGDAVATLLAEPERRRRIGEAGQDRVRKLFDIHLMSQAHHDLYMALSPVTTKRTQASGVRSGRIRGSVGREGRNQGRGGRTNGRPNGREG